MWIEILSAFAISCDTLSLPLRECGLKYSVNRCLTGENIVTPFAGVWIEILKNVMEFIYREVTPFAGVWIEIEKVIYRKCASFVTPFAGVWIEIPPSVLTSIIFSVTPFAGVWIEILACLGLIIRLFCHSLCGSVD